MGMARVAAPLVVGGAALLGPWAGHAAAELNGPCEAQGVIDETGVEIDPSVSDGPFEVPLEGTVTWFGQIGDGQDTEERSHNGAIEVVAPPLFKELAGGLLEFRDWGEDDAVTTSASGVDQYELPDITPRNTEIIVTGFHDDELGSCDGQVTVIVEGSALDSPLAVASLGATVLTGAGLAAAAFARGGR